MIKNEKIKMQKMNNTQNLEARIRDLHGELMAMRQQIDSETSERRGGEQDLSLAVQRLQSLMQDQENRRNDVIKQLYTQEGFNNNKISEEAKRLNEKIQLITDEVLKAIQSREQKIRDETNDKYLILEKVSI